MLDERIVERLTERLVNRIEQGNEYVLEQIGYAIGKFGEINPTGANQLAKILKYGGNYNQIATRLAKITKLNIQDIYDIFEEVAKENQAFAKQFYAYRNIEYMPYEKNKELQKQVKALAKITAKQYMNLSNTLAFAVKDKKGNLIYKPIRKAYMDAIDEAVLSVSQGKDVFNTQMKKVLKELGQSGLRTVEYESGYHRRLDSAVRMNIQGALRDLTNELQQQFGQEYGADGIEISVHINPAPDHAPIQGRQFSNEEFEKMQNEEDFEDTEGNKYLAIKRHIGQWNCYHYTFSIVQGVSKPNYSDKELKDIQEKNNKGFEYKGKRYTKYDGTQMQRKLETNIRQWKETGIIAKSGNNEELYRESRVKVRELLFDYNYISKVAGLETKLDRLRVNYK